MGPEDIRKIRIPGGVAVSPDGALVAFVVTAIRGDAYDAAIHVAAADGSGAPIQLTEGQLTEGPRDAGPAWSPDGREIAFLRVDERGYHQLHVVVATGGAVRKLTDHPLGVGSPVTTRHARARAAAVWSPDGAAIAYTARIPAADASLDPQAPRRITRLRYRIDELGTVAGRPSHAFVVARDGGAATRVTDCEVWDIAWHPDGRHLVAAAACHADSDLDEANDVVVLGLDGTLRCLTRGSTTVNLPTCAPDGRTLYFLGIGPLDGDPLDARGRNLGLWRVPIEGGAPVRVTDAETVDLDDGRTRPLHVTGTHVLGGLLARGAVHLVAIDGVGGGTRDVIAGRRQVVDYACAGGTVAACVADDTSAGEVIVLRDGRERALTALGAELAATGLRPMREVAARAPDGYPVHGWLVMPEGPPPHRLLLCIHGGPDTQSGHCLFDEAQVYAAAGYAVLLANPRGSAGYGEAHARAIKGRIGTVDADDLIALLDAACARDDIDRRRVGVLGGSYGGLMTAWLAAHHGARFRAALCERGVYAWDSMIGTSDIGWAATSMIGADPARWAGQQPLSFAGAIEIPTLIMHWEGDLRVPFEQAQRLFAVLRKHRRPVELVVFPGGSHNASRNGPPVQRIARFRIVLEWFGRHLV